MYGAADKSLFAGVELMIAVQLIVYLLVFTLMVKIAVRDNALNGIYFYPREVQKRAVEIIKSFCLAGIQNTMNQFNNK
jgi:hypothetical protein